MIVSVAASRRDELLDTARGVRSVEPEAGDHVRLELIFDDLRHALWAVWQLDTAAEVIAPDVLRAALHERAAQLSALYVTSPTV